VLLNIRVSTTTGVRAGGPLGGESANSGIACILGRDKCVFVLKKEAPDFRDAEGIL
jgi:hypothetical protein